MPSAARTDRRSAHRSLSVAGRQPRIAAAARWLSIALLACLIVIVTLAPSDSVGVEQGGALPLLPIAVLAWVASFVAGGQRSSRLDRLFDMTVWVLALWMWIAAVAVSGVGDVRAAINEAWWWTTAAAAITAARRSLAAERVRASVLVLLVALSCSLAVQAAHQQWVSLPAERAQYEADPEEVIQRFQRETGIAAPPGSPQRALFEGRLYGGGPTATFALQNSLAAYLVIGVMLSGGILLRLRSQHPLAVRLAVATALSMVLCAMALVWTASRSALLAVAVVGGWSLVWPLLRWRRENPRQSTPATMRLRSMRTAAVMAGVVAVLLAIAALWRRAPWLAGARRSLQYRREYWRATLDMLADYPWFGAGPGNFQDRYATYRLDEASEGIADPHNWVMETWAAGGAPALLLLAAAIAIGCLILARRPELPNAAARQRWAIATGAIVGLLGVLVAWISQRYLPDFDALVLSVLTTVAMGLALRPLALRPLGQGPLGQGPLGKVQSMGNGAGEGGEVRPLAGPAVAGPAVVAVAVHLLAAGGWTVPGVAVPLLVLIGLTIGPPQPDTEANAGRPGGAGGRWIIAAIGIAVALCWFGTAWLPRARVTAHFARGAAALDAGRIDLAIEAFRAAEQADPWDPQPAVRRADAWRWAIVQHENSPALRRRWEQAWESAVRRNRGSANLWSGRAEQRLHFYQRWGEREDLQRARQDLLQAIGLSRSNVTLAAQLAVVEAAIGNQREAEQWRLRAEELAAAGEHADRQLSLVQILPAEAMGGRAEAGPLRVPASSRLPSHEPQ